MHVCKLVFFYNNLLPPCQAWPKDLITGLTKHKEIDQEIEALLKVISEKAGVASADEF